MTASTSLRQRVLAALRDGRRRSIAVLAQCCGTSDVGSVSGAVGALVHNGDAQRVGPSPRTRRYDTRPVEITAKGSKALAQIEAAAKREPLPPSRLRSLPLLMVACGGVERRDDCVHYERCVEVAAFKIPGAAQCPEACPHHAARVVSAVAYTSSGRSNGESAIYAGVGL